MSKVLVRYKLKEGKTAENEALIKEVYKELHAANPAGFSYTTYKLNDGLSFVHIAENTRADGKNPLSEIVAFKNFQKDIKERCDELPEANQPEIVGSYTGRAE